MTKIVQRLLAIRVPDGGESPLQPTQFKPIPPTEPSDSVNSLHGPPAGQQTAA